MAWLGRDYRKRPAAYLELGRTSLEFAVEQGEFEDAEWAQMLNGLTVIDERSARLINATSHARLSYFARYKMAEIESPIGIFKFRHKATGETRDWLPADELTENVSWAARNLDNFALDCGYVAGQEAAAIYRHTSAPGVQLWVLRTPLAFNSFIDLPPEQDYLGQGEVHWLPFNGHVAWGATLDPSYGPFELVADCNESLTYLWLDSNTLGQDLRTASAIAAKILKTD